MSTNSPTQSGLVQAFQALEDADKGTPFDRKVLWPRTPVTDNRLQEQIEKFVGVSDCVTTVDAHSRPVVIYKALRELRIVKQLPPDFQALDVPCGDARILSFLAAKFESARLYGIDANIGAYENHAACESQRVLLFRIFLQTLFSVMLPEKLDVVMMLNTFRNWKSADLRPGEANLPQLAETWLMTNARYVILTATDEKLKDLGKHHDVRLLDTAEEGCRMAIIKPRTQ